MLFLGHPDPDPDPLSTKDPYNFNFLVKLNCLKYSFCKIFFIFTFMCHKMFIFGKEMP